MKKVFFQILFVFLVCFSSSCQSSKDKWYLGEWENVVKQNNYTWNLKLTPDSIISNGDEYPVSYKTDDSGRIVVVFRDEDEFDFYIYADPKTKKVYADDYYDGDTHEFHLVQASSPDTSNKSNSQQASSSKKNDGSDKKWKAAFDNGYLVLKSEERYTKLRSTSYIYIVLQGYGENFKRGKATVHFDGYIENTGIYDYDDGVLIFPEIYTATGYPADNIAVEGRIFNVEFSPSISITEYKEPFQGKVMTIKYRQTYSGDLPAYKQSSNPHPRFQK